MTTTTGMEADLSLLRQRHPNLLRVLQECAPNSPICTARDKEQPAQGYLTPRSADTFLPKSSKAAAILQCKALHNEKLTPSLQQEVTLSIGNSLLLRKRSRNSC
jgi:hypothetical protein